MRRQGEFKTPSFEKIMSSQKLVHTNPARVAEIDKEEMGFIRLSLGLLTSPAWQYKSTLVGKLLNFLFIEHLSHAGTENGNLLATYTQLSAYGIGKQYINLTIQEAEELGLIVCDRGMRVNVCDSYPNKFRLTFFKSKEEDSYGRTIYIAPTKEWKHISKEKAIDISKRYKRLRSEINKKRSSK